MYRGKFIVLEGICGSGKTTLAKQLMSLLQGRGIKTIYNHGACTDTDTGRLFKKTVSMYPDNDYTSYYVADLVQDTMSNIKSWLDDGYFVIQDRYIDSIISYFRAFNHFREAQLDIKPVIDLYSELNLLIKPELTIWCKASPNVILTRLGGSDSSERQRNLYIRQPQLIDLVQEEFARLIAELEDAALTMETDTQVNLEPVLRSLGIDLELSI